MIGNEVVQLCGCPDRPGMVGAGEHRALITPYTYRLLNNPPMFSPSLPPGLVEDKTAQNLPRLSDSNELVPMAIL